MLKKVNIVKIIFCVCLTFSIGLLTVSFFLPPKGEIHPSVLQATAEIFAFAALAVGARAIDLGRTAKIERGNTVLTIGDENETD